MQTSAKVAKQQLTGASGDPVIAIQFTGDISSASKDAVVGTYQALDKSESRKILLDFKQVDYLNSSGIALIIQILMEANKAKQQIVISGLTPHFNKVFGMVGITKYAALYPDQAAALASL